jgi:predicted MFS family arabinose efflux permease
VWQLAVLQALYGTARGFSGPALAALVPQTVDAADVQPANALVELSRNVAMVLGPALAGVIVAGIGAGWALGFDGVSFVGRVHVTIVAVDHRDLVHDLHRLRLRAVRRARPPGGPDLARGVGAWAAISTAVGGGAIAGGLIGMRWHPRHPLRAAFSVFLIGGPALYVLLAAHAPLGVIVAVALVDGVSGTLFNTFWSTALQRDVPPSELSRVVSWDYLGSLALLPVGQLITGPIAESIGVSETLYVAAGLCLVLILGVLAVPAVRNFTGRHVAA